MENEKITIKQFLNLVGAKQDNNVYNFVIDDKVYWIHFNSNNSYTLTDNNFFFIIDGILINEKEKLVLFVHDEHFIGSLNFE